MLTVRLGIIEDILKNKEELTQLTEGLRKILTVLEGK